MVSSRIRKIRREKDISGTEIAERMGISAQYYYDIEKGKRNLSAENAAKLAEIFDETTDYLLGISDIRKIGNQLLMEHDGSVREMTTEESEIHENAIKETIVKKALDEKVRDAYEKGDIYSEFIEKEFSIIKENYPSYANSRDKNDLKKFLEQSEIMFDGVPMTEEERAKIQGFMESMFWDAKSKNKRKKNTED